MTKTSPSPLRAIVVVTLIVVAAMTILVSSSGTALRIARKSAPLIVATMDVKFQLSLYHLWFEELVQQDTTVERGQVWQHLNQARWYANAMLEGGENQEGKFQALDDPAFRSMIRKTLDQMERFEAVAMDRLEQAGSGLAGSDKDQAFDKVFTEVLKIADDVETAVHLSMAAQIKQFERLVNILGAAIILVGLVGGLLFFLFEQRRKSDYALLLKSKEQLGREQALLRSLIDSIPDLIFFKDHESVYLGCNKAFEEFTGRVESEIVGITDLEMFNPELGEFFREKDRQMLAEGRVRRNEEWVDYPDGRRVLLDTVKTPYYGPDGELLGLIGISRDITERYQVGERLRKSQASLSEAQRLAHIGNWDLDTLTNEIWWSDEIWRIFEIDRDKFAATYAGFLDVIHPEDREEVNRAYSESVRDRSPYDIVHRLLMSNGRIKYVHERCETFYDETGAALRSMGTVQDITERHQTQAALHESERRLALLLNTLPHGIQENDTKGVITYSNIAHHRILGWHPGELIGHHIWDFQRDGKYKQELRDHLAFLVAEQPSPEPYVTHNVTKKGREVLLEITWDYQRNAAGAVTGFISVISDITSRAQAEQTLREKEERYRELVENMSDGVAVYEVVGDGEDFVFKEHNRAGERVTGMPREQVIGKPVRQAFPGIEEMGLFDVFQRVWRSGEPEHYPVNQYQDDDLTFWVENYVFKLPGGEIVAVFEDITERKQAEEVIRTLNRELEDRVRERTSELKASNKELESFSYSVSHDLRAPLRAIDGFSLALAEDYGDQLDETALDYLQRVRSGAQRMGLLIDDLLQLSRVNRGELQVEEADLAEIAEAVLEELRAGEPGRQVELILDRDMRVRGDPRLLRVMLDNLLGNAWKFTSQEVVSCITFMRQTDNQEVFHISDNGVGFDTRHADKLFGAFQRLHLVTDFPGTGVGLATVQRIVHRHGGRIWAEAQEGEGATFYFSLGPTGGSQVESTTQQGEQ